MVTLQGKSVCGGIAKGPLYYYKRSAGAVSRRHAEPEAELTRFHTAKEAAIAQLGQLYDKVLAEMGTHGAALFEVHQMMLEDEDYCDSICDIIQRQKVNAEYAVAVTADNFARMFSEMDDDYMRERAADVRDISERVIGILLGKTDNGIQSAQPVIVAADDLAPSETVQLDKSKILAFVTSQGSTNSHTAILARTMGIPAIIGVGDALSQDMDGKQAIVDGFKGIVYLEPDVDTTAELERQNQEEIQRKALLEQLRGKPSVTLDGKTIQVYANIGSPGDVGSVLQNDAEGIGLFRSEFLYLESEDYPSEEKLTSAYKSVAETMAGKKVIIRTLDIGADKQADYFQLPKEENPAMGLRAIRLCLTREGLFKTQLRAIYRASAFGNIAIMFPMIISLQEVRRIKALVSQVKDELKRDGISFSEDVELGIMIETPAAAVISDLLAEEVDFFSIGSNDLTQYTLAIDRQNQSLEPFCDEHHQAVLRLIALSCENAHKAGIWVGICGELGADESMTQQLLEMGIDEFSVSPPAVLRIRQKIRQSKAFS